MGRIFLLAAAVACAALPARAQSLDGGIWSGFQTGLGGGFQSGLGGGFQSGLGARDPFRQARIDDYTLGGGGGFRAGFLRGQPSNYGPSVQSMGPLQGSTLRPENGPQTSVDLGAGPEGPLD